MSPSDRTASRTRSFPRPRLRDRRGLPFLLAFTILGFAPSASPSDLHRALPLDPTSMDPQLVVELGEWIDTEELDVREQIRTRPASFEVFRSYHEEDLRHEPLRELPYGEAIEVVADRHGVDALLVASVVEVESRFRPSAVSHRGAVGLMQILPSTAQLPAEALLDPETNLDRGAHYLRKLLVRYDGDLELALAAYNAGPSNVRRYGGVPPFRETRHYVRKVLDLYVGHHRDVWQASEDTGADAAPEAALGR